MPDEDKTMIVYINSYRRRNNNGLWT